MGGEAAIAGWRWAGWRGLTKARPYIAAVCGIAALAAKGCGGGVSAVRLGEGGGD